MSNEFVRPAFPVSSEMLGHNPGMSLRDYFAAKAMASWIIAAPVIDGSNREHRESLSEIAYATADAMLSERSKQP